MNTQIISKITKPAVDICRKMALKGRKIAPEAILGMGIVGAVVTVVEVVKASKEAEPIKEAMDEELAMVVNHTDKGVIDQKEARQQVIRIYRDYGIKYIKIYGPSISIGLSSLGMIVGSHVLVRKSEKKVKRDLENLGQAYNALNVAYNGLRKRIREKFGVDVEKELVYGDSSITTKESYVDENGKKKTKNVTQRKFDEEVPTDPYTFYFNRFNVKGLFWDQDPYQNREFLMSVQEMADAELKRKGYLFLSDVLASLGMRQTPASRVVGWVLGGDGDNFVDFGFEEAFTQAYVLDSDLCKDIRLCFNCDGNILDIYERYAKG